MKRIVFGLTLGVILACVVGGVTARDLDGRYANSPLKSWFDRLASGKDFAARWRMVKASQIRIGIQGRPLSSPP